MTRRTRGGRRAIPRLVPALVASSLLVGCSLLIDTADLSGPPLGSDAGPSDAGPSDTSVVDVRDASTSDVTVPDASTCDATFCDDFDGVDDGGLTRWTAPEISGSATLQLSQMDPRSAPNTLRATLVDTGSTGPTHIAWLHRTLPRGSRISCELDVKLVTAVNYRWMDVMRFETAGPGVARYDIWWGIRDNRVGMFREDLHKPDFSCECPRQEFTPSSIPLGVWTHIKMTTDFQTATVEQNGTVVGAGVFGGFTPTADFDVTIGAYGTSDITGSVDIDNVRCAVTPP